METNNSSAVKTKEITGKYEVICPRCQVEYGVDALLQTPIQCMDCGCVYIQKTHSDIVIDWVREKIVTVGGC